MAANIIVIAAIAGMDAVFRLVKLSAVYGIHRRLTRGQPDFRDREIDVRCGDISIRSRVDGD
jgi:hypothetical protein